MGEYAARRGSARLPIKASVRVRFPGVDEPYEGTVGNISMSGMFISGAAPMPAGTLMHFEFRPSEQWHTLRGRGRVVWARQQEGTDSAPPGMGVRFIELDERGRRGVRWLIETYQSVGDKPFETWSVPSQFTRSLPAEGDVLATQEIEPVPPSPEAPRFEPKRWLPLAAGLVGVAILAWALLGRGDRPQGGSDASDAPPQVAEAPPEARPEPPAASSEAPAASPEATPEPPVLAAEPAATAVPAGAPAPPAAVEPGVASSGTEPAVATVLAELVGEWAAAWSSQDLDRYLAFYSEDFAPEGGISRTAWEGQRADRLARPKFINVTTDGVQVLDEASENPRTVFTQLYESDTFGDVVTKSLTWVRSEGSWRIISEQSAP